MAKINILIAYPFFTNEMVKILQETDRDSYRLILDSGAYSAWTTGKQIDLNEYCSFLDSIKSLRPFYAVQLDVFGDPEASYTNFIRMKEKGYDVIPVFTRGESLYRLEQFYQDTDYIMFGGIVTGGKNRNYIKWFMEKNKGRKVHWLGFTDIKFIKYYKPTSVDSSSWVSATRFGNIGIYQGYGKMSTLNRKVIENNIECKSMRKLHTTLGLTLEEVNRLRRKDAWLKMRVDPFKDNEIYGISQFIHTMSHIVKALDIEKNLGTKVYLAVRGPVHLRIVLNAKKMLEERGKI